MILLTKKRLSLLMASMCLSGMAHAVDVTGAGSSFVFPVISQWSQDYSKTADNRVNYQSIGSGAGIKQIQAKTVTFGATDAPLKGPALEKDGLVQFPTVMGGVVTVVNIAGVEPGKLKLTGELIADIYANKITKWSDAKIAAVNQGLVALLGGIGRFLAMVAAVIALGAGIISTVPGLFDDVLGFLPLSAAQNALSGVVEGTDGTAGAVVGLVIWLLFGLLLTVAAIARRRVVSVRALHRTAEA